MSVSGSGLNLEESGLGLLDSGSRSGDSSRETLPSELVCVDSGDAGGFYRETE